MKRIGFFVDVSNLYYCVKKHFKGRQLDYRRYYDFVKDFGDITTAIAYGSEVGDETEKFKQVLKNIGFKPKYKKVRELNNERIRADWDVGITIDLVLLVPLLDTIVLGSADGALTPAVEYCRAQGCDVVILARGISRDLKEVATEAIEIPESLVEPFRRKKKREAYPTKRT